MESTLSKPERNKILSICFLIIILPYILLYWMMPFVSDMTLGADYQIFSINEQIELLFSVKTGSFPLYVPGYKLGHSASALTLGQIYHPISHIASILPGYWDGKANEWNTFLRLLSLGLVHLLIFVFLRKIRLSTLFSFLISLITVYNLRMLEAFRYGASLEAYTGTLLLCILIGWHFISRSGWLVPSGIIAAAYLLVCSGHPPMIFYGLLGAGVFTLVAPFFLTAILAERDINFKIAFGFWIKTGCCLLLGILLSSAYTIPFYFEFLPSNIEYTSFGFQPHMGQDTIAGALNNFFMPLASDVLSAFGGASLFIMTLILPLLRVFRVVIPRSIWAVWGIMIFVLLYILGPQTPVFRLAWKYLPLVSSAGGVGRISLIVPVLIMMMLAWIVNSGPVSIKLRNSRLTLPPYVILAAAALILTPLYLLPVFMLKPALGFFTPHFIRGIPFMTEFLSVVFGMTALLVMVFYGIYPEKARFFGTILCLTVLMNVGILMKYGTFIETKYDKPSFEQMKTQKKEKLDFRFHQNPAMFHGVVLNHLKHTFAEPFLGKIFTEAVSVESQEEAYEKMAKNRLPRQLFIEGYKFNEAKAMTEGAVDMEEGQVELTYSSFNRLEFMVKSEANAMFGLSYPYTGHWSAWVNGEKVEVYRANGAAHAIEIPAGESRIEFRYWSDAFFWGMVVSFTTFAIIGLFTCIRGLRGMPGIIGAVVVLVLSAGGFMMWYSSLYNGDNLETEYKWTYAPPIKAPNLAYGKRTPSYYLYNTSILRHHSGSVVDGNTEPGSGVTIKPLNEALIVDLNQMQEIKIVILFGEFKTRPDISLSQDNLKWQQIAFDIAEDNKNAPQRIIFEKPENARYIKVEAIDSEMGIDELEVYSSTY